MKKLTAGVRNEAEFLMNEQNRHELYIRMIYEVEDYAIILLNKEGIIQNWNKGAEKLSNIPKPK